MEQLNSKQRFVYTREQLLKIRDTCLLRQDLAKFPIRPSVVTLEPELRIIRRKRRPSKLSISNTTSLETDDVSKISGDNGLGTDQQHPQSACWLRGQKSQGGAPISPLDSSAASGYHRHNSGSSCGDDFSGASGSRKDIDWTLGCGKWRHRSTSDSEHGNLKTAFLPRGGRGRARGDGISNYQRQHVQGGAAFPNATSTSTTRGRGFYRRPYQPNSSFVRGGRGGGVKLSSSPTANGYPLDHGPTADDFEPHDPQSWVPYLHAASGACDDVGLGGATSLKPATSIVDQAPAQFPDHFKSPSHNSVTVQPTLSHTNDTQAESQLSQSVEFKEAFSFMSNYPTQPPAATDGGAGDRQTPFPLPPPPLVPPPPPALTPLPSTQWYYRDTHGSTQGPYDDITMAGWFAAGYFPISVEVRRECDRVFSRLTDFITWLGRFPFIGSSELPPILQSQAVDSPNALPMSVLAPKATETPRLPVHSSCTSMSPLAQIAKNTTVSEPLTETPVSEGIHLKADSKKPVGKVPTPSVINHKNLPQPGAVLGVTPPPTVIDVRLLEASMPHLPQEPPTSSSNNSTTVVSADKLTGVSEIDTEKVIATSHQHHPAASKPAPTKSDSPPPPPPQVETRVDASHNKKKNRKKNVSTAFEEGKKISTSPTPVTVHEPDEVWEAVPADNAFFPVTPLPQTLTPVAQPPKQETNKAKNKKKKPKPTARDLQQKAWEQEEERRKVLNAERIAREQAEAEAWAAEEAAVSLAASEQPEAAKTRKTKADTAAHLQEQQRARDAAKKQAAASLAHLKLPSSVHWGSNPQVGGGSAKNPVCMEEIFASQIQEKEEEFVGTRSKWTTFASKVAVNPPRPSTSPQVGLVQQSQQRQSAVTHGKSPTVPPNKIKKPTQVKDVDLPAKKVMETAKPLALSIWDLPADLNSMSITKSKKGNRKKKVGASSQLLSGSLISLPPKARVELIKWCEVQLSGFPNSDVDLPTLISILCDMEDADGVLECIEDSFGKSQRVSKFSKAFIEKRANLMGTTA